MRKPLLFLKRLPGRFPELTGTNMGVIRDGLTTTTTIFEFISRGPIFHFGVHPDDAPNDPSTQWNTEKPKRFFIWCAIKCRFGVASDAKLFWKIMVVVVVGPSLRLGPRLRGRTQGDKRQSAIFCGFLRFSAVSCKEQRFAAKIRVSQMACFLGEKEKSSASSKPLAWPCLQILVVKKYLILRGNSRWNILE